MNDPAQSEKRTLVEEGTELKGTLKSSCPIVVNGSIDGQIEAPALTVTNTGTVLGNVKAEKLRSEGTLAGDIDASDVYLSGTVRSNTMIRAKTLEVKLAPERGKLEVTFGECLVEVGEDPAVRQEDADDSTAPSAELGAAAEPPAVQGGTGDTASRDTGEVKEPTWSEPPALSAGAEASDNASAADEVDAADPEGNGSAWTDDAAQASEADGNSSNGKRSKKKKKSDNRESQAPPAE